MIPAGTVRRVPDRPEPPPAPVIVPRAPLPARRSGAWMGILAGVAAGGLIGGALFGGFGHALGDRAVGLGLLDLLLAGGGIVVLLILVRRRQASRAQPTRAAVSISSSRYFVSWCGGLIAWIGYRKRRRTLMSIGRRFIVGLSS